MAQNLTGLAQRCPGKKAAKYLETKSVHQKFTPL